MALYPGFSLAFPVVIVLLLKMTSRSETTSIGATENDEDVTREGEGRRFRREITDADLSQIREAVKALEDDAKKAATKNKELRDKVADQENTIKLLQYTNDEIMTRMEELEGANFRLMAANKVLNSTVRIMDDKNNNLVAELQSLVDERTNLAAELAIVKNKTETVKADLGIVQKKQIFTKTRIDSLGAARKKMAIKLVTLNTKDEVLEAKIMEANVEIQALHASATLMEAVVNELGSVKDETESRLAILEAGIANVEIAKDDLFAKVGVLETAKSLTETKLKGTIEVTKELQTDIWKIENWKIENINRTMHSKVWNIQSRLEDTRGRIDGRLAELNNVDQKITRDVEQVSNAIPDLKEELEAASDRISKVSQCQIGYVNNPTDPLSGYGISGQEIGIAFKHSFKDKPEVKLALTAISGFLPGDGYSFIGGRGREVLGIRGTDHSTIGGPSVVTKDGFRVTLRASKAGEKGKVDSLYMMYIACGVFA